MRYQAFLDHYKTRNPQIVTLREAFLARQQDRIEFESQLHKCDKIQLVYEDLPPGGIPDYGVDDDWWQGWYTVYWKDGTKQLKGYPYGVDGLGHMDCWQYLLTALNVYDKVGVIGLTIEDFQQLPYGKRPYQEYVIQQADADRAKAAARAEAARTKAAAAASKPVVPVKSAPAATPLASRKSTLSTVAPTASSAVPIEEDTVMTNQSEQRSPDHNDTVN
jgi:hypothetical protein